MSYDCQGLAKYFVFFLQLAVVCVTLFNLNKLCTVLHSLLILGCGCKQMLSKLLKPSSDVTSIKFR